MWRSFKVYPSEARKIFWAYFIMAMEQVLLHWNTSTFAQYCALRKFRLPVQHIIAKAVEGQSLYMQNIAVKSGAAQAAPAALLPEAMPL